MKRVFAAAMRAGQSADELKATVDAEAARVHDEDVASCRALGSSWRRGGAGRGAGADALQRRCVGHRGYGSALGVVRAAVDAGKRVAVYADETGRSCRAPG